MVTDLNMSHRKMSDFVSFPLFGFTLVIKLRNFDFESHWNTLIFFDKKRYGVRFEYVPWKNVWFCFISIVWVHFSHKTEKFRFWKSLKYFNIFDERRYGVRFEYVPWKNVWFYFISIVWSYFSHKTEKFQFERSLKHFNIFWQRNDVRFDYVLSNSV